MGHGINRSSPRGFSPRHIMPFLLGAFLMFSSPAFGRGPLYSPDLGTGGGSTTNSTRNQSKDFARNATALQQHVQKIGVGVAYFKNKFEQFKRDLDTSNPNEISGLSTTPLSAFTANNPDRSYSSNLRQLQRDIAEANKLANQMGLKRADGSVLFAFSGELTFAQLEVIQVDYTDNLAPALAMRQRELASASGTASRERPLPIPLGGTTPKLIPQPPSSEQDAKESSEAVTY